MNLLFANDEIQDILELECIFLRLACDLKGTALRVHLATNQRKYLQVQLVASCDYVRVRLTRA